MIRSSIHRRLHPWSSLLACATLLLLTGCEQLGIETPAQKEAQREAEGRAVGGACRHAGRALEDCYELNPRAAKAAVYAGWRDMDSYMRENLIDVIEPEFEPKENPTKPVYSKPEEKPAEPAKVEKPVEKKPEPAVEEKKAPEPAKNGKAPAPAKSTPAKGTPAKNTSSKSASAKSST